ncbi:MAG: NADH-quinone oxidoreductase subunit NuoG [Armatimonadetes bacterium]|nr:NADH-quinone oxidoreductase subunit NuoG [Armatimonadota bacterium]MDW8120919.1 NADH-quinone oxidoreductase subunit NuoG [Armatimonadota bacterium]
MAQRLDWDELVALMWGKTAELTDAVPANMLAGTTVGLRYRPDQPSAKQVTVTIDGKTLQVPEGTLIIEAVKMAGLDIPHFCYHPRMAPVGVCRQCLVEVGTPRRAPDGSLVKDESGQVLIQWMPKPQTSCTMLVSDGMHVRVNSEVANAARRAITEFLLINHPLDCPVCDRGGECPLQNVAFVQGRPYSRFLEQKRFFAKPVALSQHILLDRERCIMCKRCIRFCDELAGEKQLEQIERGWWSYIAVAEGEELDTIFSGNVIDICPVGALTSHPYRFAARPWELTRTKTVCPKCPVHCTIFADCRFNQPKRFVPAGENFQVNDIWMCDIGRFELRFPKPEERVLAPHLRINGELMAISWEDALHHLTQAIRHSQEPFFVGTAAMTNEEAYLFQRFARSVAHSPNVDFPERDPLVTQLVLKTRRGHLGCSIYDLQKADLIVLAGCNLYRHLPIAWFWVLQAVKDRGAKLVGLGIEEDKPRMKRWSWKWLTEVDPEAALSFLLMTVTGSHQGTGAPLTEDATRHLTEVAQALKDSQRPVIVCAGQDDPKPISPNTAFAVVNAFSRAEWKGVFYSVHRANSVGCLLAGLCPLSLPGLRTCEDESAQYLLKRLWGAEGAFRIGKSIADGVTSEIFKNGSVVWIVDPSPIHQPPQWLTEAVETIPRLVVSSSHWTPLARKAWLVLPDLTFLEKNGTYTNWSGLTQKVNRSVTPPDGVRSLAVILFDLASRLGSHFYYPVPSAVAKELETLCQLTDAIPLTG